MAQPNSGDETRVFHYHEAPPPSPDQGIDRYEILEPGNEDLTIRFGYGGRVLAVFAESEGEPPTGKIDDEEIQWRFVSITQDRPDDGGEWLSTPIPDGRHNITVNNWTGAVDLKSMHLDLQEGWDEIQLENQPYVSQPARQEVLIQNEEWKISLKQVGGAILLEYFSENPENTPDPITVNGVQMGEWTLNGKGYVMSVSDFFKTHPVYASRTSGALRIEFRGQIKEINVIPDPSYPQQFLT